MLFRYTLPDEEKEYSKLKRSIKNLTPEGYKIFKENLVQESYKNLPGAPFIALT